MADPMTMAPPATPEAQRQLHVARERMIGQLSERFASGDLEVDDFERRLDDLHRCTSLTELERQNDDLQQTEAATVTVSAPAAALVPAEHAPLQKQVLVVFGSSERRGTWAVPRRLKVTAVFGNVELDFREARMPAGVVDVDAKAAFGNIEILVPPHLAVETEGSGVFGNFEHMERAPAVPDPNAPLLRITGVSVFGNIEISTRLAGDGKRGHRRGR